MAFNNVKVADLQQNPCLCHDFYALGTSFANVEVLKISNRFIHKNIEELLYSRYSRLEHERSFSDGNGGLQDALVRMRDLHTLELDLQHGEDDPDWPAPKNPILASLPKLSTLKIPLAMLVMEHRRSNRNRIGQLKDVLPKSLSYLTFTVEVDCPDHWWSGGPHTDPTWPPTSKIGVLVFMEELSKLGREAFPDLCEIVCCYKLNLQDRRFQYGGVEIITTDFEGKNLFEFSEVDEDYDPQRFELLQSSLQQQNWQFKVTYEHTHCSCEVLLV